METLRDWWGMFLAAVALIGWLVRMEARTFTNTSSIDQLRALRKEDLEAAKEARREQAKMLEEIRADVKEILRSQK